MRKKRLAYNSISALIYQITAILCGFVLPRLILKTYNSDVNGLVNSVTQFLQIIAILDLGVGSVVKSSLYNPLSKNDNIEVSKVMKSAKKFFNNIAKILMIYMLLLPFIIIIFVNNSFSFLFTASLIFSIGINYFSQYYFGIVNQLLLNADQKGYIQYNLQTVTLIINTLVCSFLILEGASIQIVKLATSIIFLVRPLYLKRYVDKHYKIDYKVVYNKEPIKQKWNGIAQHLTAVILDSTDTIILTIFSTLKSVSIYSVYYLVVHGIRQLMQSLTSGIQSLLGNLKANNEEEKLQSFFEISEWSIHTLTVFVFGCTSILIVPFILVYTKGVNDANYINYLFGYLLTYAHGIFCLRIPYHSLITSLGYYKETQNIHIISMIINIVVSISFVNFFGLIGVAIGTLLSMAYQTIFLAHYCYKHILKISKKRFYKQLFVDMVAVVLGMIFSNLVYYSVTSLVSLIYYAIIVAAIWLTILIIINFIMYFNRIKRLLIIFKSKLGDCK